MDAIKTIKQELKGDLPLIGFTGSPWTLATYMVEGRGSKQFTQIRKMLYSNPILLHLLLEKVTDVVIAYLKAQIDSGVDVVQIFDSWGGVLTPSTYKEFSLMYMQAIVSSIREYSDVPIIIFTKGSGLWLDQIKSVAPDCIGLDWSISTKEARACIGNDICLQGNLDPAVLYGSHQSIEHHVEHVMSGFSSVGHIFNLGHGIYPDVDPENVTAMITAVRKFSR
jgi:uroporphyrinogen decarboxylase